MEFIQLPLVLSRKRKLILYVLSVDSTPLDKYNFCYELWDRLSTSCLRIRECITASNNKIFSIKIYRDILQFIVTRRNHRNLSVFCYAYTDTHIASEVKKQ